MLGLFEGRLASMGPVITSSSSATGVDGDEYDGSSIAAWSAAASAASSHKRARAVTDDFLSSSIIYDCNDDTFIVHQPPQEYATVARKRAKKEGRGESFPCNCTIGGHRKGALLPAKLFGVFKGGGRKKSCLAGAARAAAERAATRAAALAADPIKFKAEQKTIGAKYNPAINARAREARAVEARALYARYTLDNPYLAEARLDPAALAALAGKLVTEIEVALQKAERDGTSVGFNVCTGKMSTMKTKLLCSSECFGLARNRGAGEGRAELISKMDGSHCTPGQLIDGGWSRVFLGDLRNPENMNALEKRVHELLNRDARKLWRRDGAGGVHLDHEVRPEDNVFTIAVVFGPCGAGTPFAAGPPTEY
jgi:hypothetical protein